jgi:tetratricopeptide (TPR) repeat protein
LAAKYFLIAADRFEKHDPKNPLHALSYNNLGAVLIKMNKSKAAEAALKRAKKLAPADTFQLFNLAALFTNSAEYNQAVRCYNLILLLDPDNKDAYLARVRCLAHGGNTEDAMTSLETFLKYNPKHAQAVYNLGILYMQSGFFAKATLEFEKALSLGLKDPRVYINLGLLAQIYDKDRYRAKAYYRKYLAMGGKEKDLVAKMIKNLYKPRPEKNKEKNKENEKKKKTGPDNKYTAPDFNIGF